MTYTIERESEMPRCGTLDVELLDERTITVDTVSAERLDRLIEGIPESAEEEVQKLCMCITGARNGTLMVPNERWVGRFKATLGSLLSVNDIQLDVMGGRPLYVEKYVKQKGRRRRNG